MQANELDKATQQSKRGIIIILIAFVILPSLGLLFVGLFTGNLFFLWLLASAYKALGFSAFMYLIGFLIFLALRNTGDRISSPNQV